MSRNITMLGDDPGRKISHFSGWGHLEWRFAPGNTVEIVDIEVDNRHRREGVGRWLVSELCKQVPDSATVFAITRPTNAIAVNFYEGLNFRLIAVIRGFYTDTTGVDALMFGRKAGGAV